MHFYTSLIHNISWKLLQTECFVWLKTDLVRDLFFFGSQKTEIWFSVKPKQHVFQNCQWTKKSCAPTALLVSWTQRIILQPFKMFFMNFTHEIAPRWSEAGNKSSVVLDPVNEPRGSLMVGFGQDLESKFSSSNPNVFEFESSAFRPSFLL